MARSTASLSVILPVLNEEGGLDGALERIVQSLDSMVEHFEIIVINDGSTDRTAEIAGDFAKRDSRVRVIHNSRNLNYGVSLKSGIDAAQCDWLMHNAADLPLAPEDYGDFIARFDQADVIVASNIQRAAHSPWRKVTSWTNRALLRLLFQAKTTDMNFTQFYRRSVVAGFPLRSTSPAFVTPELIMRAERAGFRVIEIGADFQRREHGKAHFGRPKDIAWTLIDMLKLRFFTLARGWKA